MFDKGKRLGIYSFQNLKASMQSLMWPVGVSVYPSCHLVRPLASLDFQRHSMYRIYIYIYIDKYFRNVFVLLWEEFHSLHVFFH